jgi:5-formyltetrahydrofolate cyclo-ligase
MEGYLLKHSLRTQIRRQRRALDVASRQELDHVINHSLLDWVKNGSIKSLAAYWPFDGEPDLQPSLHALNELGVEVCLPVIIKTSHGISLEFRCWSPTVPMRNNPFGIPEPKQGQLILAENLDLILMPLVAWDEYGHRLGMGAGYYDRALEPLANTKPPLRAGVAYQLQKADKIPADPWDIRLHEVISEHGRFTCRA